VTFGDPGEHAPRSESELDDMLSRPSAGV